MAAENPDTFNQRLSQWVASQGFWFQVRYSMASGGSRGVVLVHLLRFLLRIFMLVAVLGVAGLVYLVKLPGSKGFRTKLEAAITTSLGAKESKLSGFQRVQGEMLIRRFASEGGNQSIFSTLEARTIKARMGLFDALPGKWRLGVLAVGDLDVQLNAGADDDAGATRIGEVLFQDFANLDFETIDVSRCSLRWGFSERARGSIIGSHVRFHRVPLGWRVQATGGQFSQSWLRRLEIVELNVLCTPEGLLFEKAEFRKAGGVLRMDGLKVTAGARPEVKGVIRVNRLPLEDLIPPATRDFLDGLISGDFQISGSTNSDEGLGFEGVVNLDDDNKVILRDRIYLLRALSEFAVYNSFKSVEFKEGSFRMKTKAGGMELTEVKIKSGELMTMAGQMRVRLPTREEAAASIQRNRAGAPVSPGNPASDGSAPGATNDPNFTLRRAAKEAQRAKEKAAADPNDEEGAAFFDRVSQSFEARLLAEQAVELAQRTLIYEGGFQITLPSETFENSPALRELFPVDSQTGRIPMDVPLKGDLYSLTFDQTEELYLRGKKYQ